MKDATAKILNELSVRGYRITKAREAIVRVLQAETQPLSIQSLCARVPKIDEASVYRTIAVLLKEGFIEELTVPGESMRYALAHGHHHHAICSACGFMEHIACTEERFSQPVPQSFKKLDAHEVTFYGVCKKCA